MKKTLLAISIASLVAPLVQAEDKIDVGGALRANYQYKSYSESSKDKVGDLKFDMLAIKFNGELDDFGITSEYRFFDGWEALRYGYVYYKPSAETQINFGLTQKPFGNAPYISNSFWFGIPYYVGFEDDADMGITAKHQSGQWTYEAGFFKNAEYGASQNQRYSTDLYTGTVNGTDYHNEETNQLNLRTAYQFEFTGGHSTLGASLEVGQIYNNETQNNGDRYAVAVHLDTTWDKWNLQLQAMQYEYDAADSANDNRIAVSAYNWQYEIASKAQVYSVNIARSFDTDWGSIKVYNDFGLLTPDVADNSFDDSLQNVLGMALSAGPTYTMIDFIAGKNMYASGVNDHVGLPQTDSGWDNRININFGYYF